MRPSNHPGHIIPQDTGPNDAGDDVITGLPISQAEIDELTYGEDRPLEERLDRLRELANDLRVRAAGEVADNDAETLIASIERAITALESRADDPGEPGALEEDPLDHRETLAPDSDELAEIEEDDEESIEDDIGEIDEDDERNDERDDEDEDE
ncbi:MAG TPA: hypothetical protein GYA10_03760, partial [Alphaproteobacteria bacterium]|nr:hypothetical protein [Alphaproteobacteria bacterium]